MATTYPGARWRPLGEQAQPRMTAHDIVCLHTMAGSLPGTDAMFHDRGYGGTESHFGLGAHGELVQWQDLAYSADANYHGSRRIISIETADMGPPFPRWSGSDVPAWTDDQLAALAELVAWLADRYDIPLELIEDSRPRQRGIGYHRQGIDPWRVPNGERWSKAAGKVCPGERRIAQIPGVIARARKISSAAGGAKDGGDAMSSQLEKDLRAMWEGMGRGALARLDKDLRADLAAKGEQLDRIEGKLDLLLGAAAAPAERSTAVDEDPGTARGVPLHPADPDGAR